MHPCNEGNKGQRERDSEQRLIAKSRKQSVESRGE